MDHAFLRRRVVFLGLAAGTLAPRALWAGSNEEGSNDSKSPFKRSKTEYTLAEFFRLDDTALEKISYHLSGRVTVEGFSNAMTKWLIRMARHDRNRLRKLVRKMSKIKGSEPRGEFLQGEIQKTKAEIAKINAKAQKILEKHGDNRIHNLRVAEMGARMAELEEFIEFMQVWQKFPKEGNMPPKVTN